MTEPLPPSGDPGGRPPRPDTLPTPALWPQREGADQPFDQLRDETVPAQSPAAVRGAWTAAGVMLLGAALLGAGVVVGVLWLALAGVAVGLAGLVVAWRVRIFAAVDLGTAKEAQQRSAEQSGGPATP